jgi:hypothetical protein
MWTSGRLLWTKQWTCGFHKRLGSSLVAAQLAVYQEGLASMKLVISWTNGYSFYIYISHSDVCEKYYSKWRRILWFKFTDVSQDNTAVIFSFEKTSTQRHCFLFHWFTLQYCRYWQFFRNVRKLQTALCYIPDVIVIVNIILVCWYVFRMLKTSK